MVNFAEHYDGETRMKRRDVVRLIAVAPASGAVFSASDLANAASPAAPASNAPAGKNERFSHVLKNFDARS